MKCKYKLPCEWCDKFNKECETDCNKRFIVFLFT